MSALGDWRPSIFSRDFLVIQSSSPERQSEPKFTSLLNYMGNDELGMAGGLLQKGELSVVY